MSYGRHTYGRPEVLEWGENTKLVVGNFCSIGGNVSILLGGNHYKEWVTTYPFAHQDRNVFDRIHYKCHYSNGDVIIGNDVWIASNVTIMSGVKIGDGAIIANNSHVVKDVEPYSIVGGNPAKFIQYRFTSEQISKLLEIKWWNLSDEIINEFTPLMCNSDIDQFIHFATEMINKSKEI